MDCDSWLLSDSIVGLLRDDDLGGGLGRIKVVGTATD